MTRVRAAFTSTPTGPTTAQLPAARAGVDSVAQRGYDAVFICEHDRGFTAERKHATTTPARGHRNTAR